MKIRMALVLTMAIAAVSAQAHKAEMAEKPKVHADFQFGTFPYSHEAFQIMAPDESKYVIVGYHEGWSIEKIAKTLKQSPMDVSRAADRLEEAGLIGRRDPNDYDTKPALPVIRESDWAKVKQPLYNSADEFAGLIQSHWSQIEAMVASLDGAKKMPKERVMYETVVSGIIYGGLIDAFYEDKTMMPPPPRRGKTDHFYAWLVESNPAAAGKLRRESHESADYQIISIGSQLPEDRPTLQDLKGNAAIYDEADARRYRSFIAVFSRDTLLPFFKDHRDEYIKLTRTMTSSGYTVFAEDFAWFYSVMANEAVDDLSATRQMVPPEKYYTYAVHLPAQ